jgi:UDP-N-acetylglucosamine 2-epimerase (non-hydrolysing)
MNISQNDLNKKIILILFGTRPEIIKLFVLYRILKDSKEFLPVLVNTSQQKISGDILEHIGLEPEVILEEIPNRSADINQFISHTLEQMNIAFSDSSPIRKEKVAGIMVQGDTTSAYCGSMWGFFNEIPVFHIEAGLRSFDHKNPFPEEFIRESISRASALNFCPTNISYQNLINEGIKSNKCLIVGNTINDAIITLLNENKIKEAKHDNKYILSTLHRRENWDKVSSYANILNDVVSKRTEQDIIHLMHPNPLVRDSFHEGLNGTVPEKLIIREPIHDYFEMLGYVKNSHIILTDSGGLQEESLFFNVPCGILRKVTERPEVLDHNAKLLDFNNNEVHAFLENSDVYKENNSGEYNYTYGTGNTSQLIYEAICQFYK